MWDPPTAGYPPTNYPPQPGPPQPYPKPVYQPPQNQQPQYQQPVYQPVYQQAIYQQPVEPQPFVVTTNPRPAVAAVGRGRGKKSGGVGSVITTILITGGVLLLACCGGMFALVDSPSGGGAVSSAGSREQFNLEAVAVPNLPKYQAGMRRQFGGAELYTIPLSANHSGHYSPPGHGGSLFFYLPPGKHPPGSLPCVLITAAGTNLLQGTKIDSISGSGEADEHLPYVQAGMAVMVYEMDGGQEVDTDAEFKAAFKDYKAAGAGMVNARNAFEYVLQNCPEVNKQQIFSAGHSSAGTAALLFAAHEPRLAGCLAYAPCTNIENFHPPGAYLKLVRAIPSIGGFMKQASPLTHTQRIRCPVFLFVSKDDTVIKLSDTNDFVNKLRGSNQNVKMQTVDFGGHYDSMISRGIPAGIQWINGQTGRASQPSVPANKSKTRRPAGR